MTEPQFDVFLCYNTEDRAAVISIAQQLKQKGLKPWMDILELQPGGIWQYALEQQIESISAAAVFVGKQGLGPWQSQEIYAFLQEFIYRKCPIIPVMLPDLQQQPKLPVFLKNRHWVDFRQNAPEPLSQLIWGITGQKPTPQSTHPNLSEELPLSHELSSAAHPNPTAPQQSVPTPPNDDLASERNLDYTRLRDLLNAGQWKEADQETANQILKAMGKKKWMDVGSKDLSNFPCTDLKTLDRLWVKYSQGKWGFSVQRKIWEEVGSPTTYGRDWERFGDRVGWRKWGRWLGYNDLTFDPQRSPPGEFTRLGFWIGGLGVDGLGGGVSVWRGCFGLWVCGGLVVLFSRTKTCGL